MARQPGEGAATVTRIAAGVRAAWLRDYGRWGWLHPWAAGVLDTVITSAVTAITALLLHASAALVLGFMIGNLLGLPVRIRRRTRRARQSRDQD